MLLSFDYFERSSMQGSNEEVTYWSSEKVGILNVSLLFSFLLFQSVEAIWEKRSFKEKTWILPHDCVDEERNFTSHIWKVCGTSTGMVSIPGNSDWGMFASIPDCHQAGPSPFTERVCEGRALQRHMCVFCKIAAKTLMPNTYWQGMYIPLFLSFQL